MSSNTAHMGNLRSIIIITLVVSLIVTAVFGGYNMANTILLPAPVQVQIEEPISILQYPSSLNLFPGQTQQFNVTVENRASIDYSVLLNYQLNDSIYQNNYVTFTNALYNVVPGQQNLMGGLSVSANAPPANLLLTITFNRNLQPIPTQPPGSPPTLNSTENNSTMHPSVQLLQVGAKWASPNGTNALYINWKDDWLLHGKTDGVNWGPWDTVETMDEWRSGVTQALQNDGFNITYAGEMPPNLTGYDLVVIEAAWGAIYPNDTATVRNFIANGGGVVMLCITPCFFSVVCTDRWPYRFGGTDLTPLANWYGYSNYVNVGGGANPSFDHPFGTSLLASDQIFYTSGSSAASVYNPIDNNTEVIAHYNSGIGASSLPFSFPSYGNTPFAFTHTYGAGRVYWQAHIWPF